MIVAALVRDEWLLLLITGSLAPFLHLAAVYSVWAPVLLTFRQMVWLDRDTLTIRVAERERLLMLFSVSFSSWGRSLRARPDLVSRPIDVSLSDIRC
jgi:hypothetical protein